MNARNVLRIADTTAACRFCAPRPRYNSECDRFRASVPASWSGFTYLDGLFRLAVRLRQDFVLIDFVVAVTAARWLLLDRLRDLTHHLADNPLRLVPPPWTRRHRTLRPVHPTSKRVTIRQARGYERRCHVEMVVPAQCDIRAGLQPDAVAPRQQCDRRACSCPARKRQLGLQGQTTPSSPSQSCNLQQPRRPGWGGGERVQLP